MQISKANPYQASWFTASKVPCQMAVDLEFCIYLDAVGTNNDDFWIDPTHLQMNVNGNWVTLAILGGGTGWYWQGQGYNSNDNYGITPTSNRDVSIATWYYTIGTGPWLDYVKLRVYLRASDLGQQLQFRLNGSWEAGGSAGLPSLTYDYLPNPTQLSTTIETECNKVILGWQLPQGLCPNTITEIYRDGLYIDWAGSTTYTDITNVPGDYTIRFKHSPNGQTNLSDFSSEIQGKPKLVPTSPAQFEATDDLCDNEVNLTWLPGSGVNNYRVYRDSVIVDVIPGSSTSYIDIVPTGAQPYDYRIQAENSCGWGSIGTPIPGVSLANPDPPMDLNAQELTGVGIQLDWTDVNHETEYEIERSLYGGGGAAFFSVPSNTTTYLDESILPCQTYQYQVRAINDCESDGILGDSTISLKVTPDLSTTFNAGDFNGSKGFYSDRVELDWLASANTNFIEGYKIFRKILGSSSDSTVLTSENASTNFYVDNLTDAGILYQYFIIGETQCENATISSNVIKAVGFRSPIGTVTGNVTYSGGIAVEGVRITAESSTAVAGQSIWLDGSSSLAINNPNNINLTNELLVESWIKPDNYNNDFILVEKPGTFSLNYRNNINEYEFTIYHDVMLSTMITIDASLIGAGSYNHIAAQLYQDSIRLYVNGNFIAGLPASNVDLNDNANNILIGNGYYGNIDELRIWSQGKGDQNILKDHSTLMIGGETGLITYLRMNEGAGDYTYDISRTGNAFNENHAGFVNSPQWSSDIPTSTQLGIATYTDAIGNYVLAIPYTGLGETFVLTPSYLTHTFDPSTRALYVGDGSSVHNNIDFEDISSFMVTGDVFYKNTSCPAEGAIIKIDGQIAIDNGQPVTVQANGTFEVEVPIGNHFIEIEKNGHGYSVGRFPSTGDYDFQQDLAGIRFWDSTLVKVVGRVVGGLREAGKIPGLGKSKNNIGQAKVILASQLGNGCAADTLFTDPNTGEYVTFLPPLRYVPEVTIPSNLAINLGVLNLVDLTNELELHTEYDSTFNSGGTLVGLDSINYHTQLDYVYRIDPVIVVKDPNGVDPFIGDTTYTYVHPVYNDSIEIDLRVNPFRWPVFMQGNDDKKYSCMIYIFEEYKNYDNTQNIVTDSVPTTDGFLNFNNELAYDPVHAIDIGESGAFNLDTLKALIYEFEPGLPNFNENLSIPEYSYIRKLEINLETTNGQVINWFPVSAANVPVGGDATFRGYLLGQQAFGNQFYTEGPQVVDYVLRDPPGSNSTASLSQGSTNTSKNSWSWNLGGKISAENKISLGTKFSLGYGVTTQTEISNDINYSISNEVKGGKGGSQSVTTTYNQTYTTSGGTDYVGTDSDLFLGSSKNAEFAITDHLTLVPDSLCGQLVCLKSLGNYSLAKRYGLAMVPQSYTTQFIYTQAHIKYVLIPDLIQTRNAILQSNTKYTSYFSVNDNLYGVSNDDPKLSVVSSNTPYRALYEDLEGLSYKYNAVDLTDSLSGDKVWDINYQIRLWEDALRENEEEKIRITDQSWRDSLKTVELAEIDSLYKETIKGFNAVTALTSGLGTALTLTPVPGTVIVGYIYFAASAGLQIFEQSIYDDYYKYQAERQRVEDKYNEYSVSNFSISGGANFTNSVTHETATSNSKEINYNMSAGLALDVGLKVGGSGSEFKRSLNLEFEKKREWGKEKTNTETVTYTLDDPDSGDFISVDVYPSMYGWGPVFKRKAGGATGCPYEPEETTQYYLDTAGTSYVLHESSQQRDKPSISCSQTLITNIPISDAAAFNLTVGNESEDGTYQAYNLQLISNTNPFGAIVRFDGFANTVVSIPAGTSINKVMTVEKGPGPVYNYDSLLVVISSQCQYANGSGYNPDIADSVYVSARFLPTCTEVSLASPEDQWVLNNSFSDTMPVAIIDYNINFYDFEKMRFDYKPSNQANWIGLQTFWRDTSGLNNPSLTPIPNNTPYTLYDWDVAQIVDGEYDVRVTTQCSQAEQFSQTYSGVMDRLNPHPFGNPSPADGILDPNDEISIRFNEPIDLGSLTGLNFDIRGVLNGTETNHYTSMYFDGVDDFAEVSGGASLQSRDFTVDFAVRRSGTGEEAILTQGIDQEENIFIGFNSDDQFVFRIGSEEVASTTTYTDNDWHYFSVSYNNENETVELFVADQTFNGLINNGNTTMYSDYEGSGRVVFGKNTVNNGNHFNGNVHEIRIWGETRTLAQFNATFNKLLNNEIGLLYNWRMDEAEGDLLKDHVRRRDAFSEGGTWAIEPSGYAVEFDGVDDYLKVSSGDVVVTEGMDMTIEFWFNSLQAGQASLFSNGSGTGLMTDSLFSWNIEKDASGQIHVKHNSIDWIAVTDDYFDGEWHHFALVLNRTGNISSYIDGDLQNSEQSIPYGQLGGPAMYLGARGYYTGVIENLDNYFEGSLEEFRFWNSARSLEQIRRDKQNRMKGEEMGLKLYLPFEDYQIDPTGIPILTASFNEQIDINHTVENPNGVVTTNATPTIKLQRPIQQIAFTYSVNVDEIIFTPTTSQELIENVTLDVTVRDIQDQHGNYMESPRTWIAYVNKNQVLWQDDLLQFNKLVGDQLQFSSGIINEGGAAKQFEILNIPDWLTVTPSSGTMPPNSTMTVNFEVDPLANIGDYTQDLQLMTDFNYPERLAIDLTVRNQGPEWTVNPADYQYSMSVIGLLKIKNVISSDVEDQLAAFSNGEVRGVQNLQYVPQTDGYLVFLDVYSNSLVPEPITFQIWDASAGIVYSEVEPDTLIFEANSLIGSTSAPQIFETNYEVSYDVQVFEGWNWICHFLYNEDSTDINRTLSSLSPLPNDEIKGQFSYADYGVANGWTGSLSNDGIQPEQLYKLKVSTDDLLVLRGDVIDPITRTIDLVNNWNWVGFISVRNQPITQALGNLNPADGDLIKGQSQFAVYDPLLGWIGSLSTMVPGRGYMYKSIGDKTFTYPKAGFFNKLETDEDEFASNIFWQVDFGQYTSNMTAILSIDYDCDDDLPAGNYAIGIFDEIGNVRGVAPLKEIENQQMAFLTIGGNNEDKLTAKLLNVDTGEELKLDVEFTYQSDKHIGSVLAPEVMDIPKSLCRQIVELEEQETGEDFLVYPSVFTDELTIQYNSEIKDSEASVILYNVLGQMMYRQQLSLDKGRNQLQIKVDNDHLIPGIYMLELETNGKRIVQKVIKGI